MLRKNSPGLGAAVLAISLPELPEPCRHKRARGYGRQCADSPGDDYHNGDGIPAGGPLRGNRVAAFSNWFSELSQGAFLPA